MPPPEELELALELDEAELAELDELLELEVDTSPLDELVDDTLPEEVEVVDERLPDEVELELPPVELVLDTLPLDVELVMPLEVELPPEEVDELLPPLEVEPPDVEVEPPDVEVEPPVEVDDTMMLLLLPPPLLPPKKPPPKKPPEKPPPLVLLPVASSTGVTGAAELNACCGKGCGTGAGMMGKGAGAAAVMVRVVTVAGAAAQAVRRTVRRTTRVVFFSRATGTLPLLVWTTAGRSGGFSLTWTAPPPIMAPPQVQAHNLAIAIRTDMPNLFLGRPWKTDPVRPEGPSRSPRLYGWRCKHLVAAQAINPVLVPWRPAGRCSVPLPDVCRDSVNSSQLRLGQTPERPSDDSLPDSGSRADSESRASGTAAVLPQYIFDRYLSDLSCLQAKRIGASGRGGDQRAK